MTDENKSEAPFNMAVASLMRLDAILTDIKNISLTQSTNNLSRSSGQHLKLKLVKDFFLQSVPLIKPENLEEIKNKVFALKPSYRDLKKDNPSLGKIPAFSETLETSLDEMLIEIQVILQSNGVFMPSKKDRLF